jgi:hypothetical protein
LLRGMIPLRLRRHETMRLIDADLQLICVSLRPWKVQFSKLRQPRRKCIPRNAKAR